MTIVKCGVMLCDEDIASEHPVFKVKLLDGWAEIFILGLQIDLVVFKAELEGIAFIAKLNLRYTVYSIVVVFKEKFGSSISL